LARSRRTHGEKHDEDSLGEKEKHRRRPPPSTVTSHPPAAARYPVARVTSCPPTHTQIMSTNSR
jgi:hypothetical protein